MSKLTRDEARDMLRKTGAELGADFHALRSEQVAVLSELARKWRYKKPMSYPGSKCRAFHAFLQRTATTKPE